MISNVIPHDETAVDDSTSDTDAPQLPEQLEKDLVQVFKLLSDETRLRILLYLTQQGELHVTALCDRLGQSQPAVSHHLALLRVAGLIEARRDGKHNFYHVRRTLSSHTQKINTARGWGWPRTANVLMPVPPHSLSHFLRRKSLFIRTAVC